MRRALPILFLAVSLAACRVDPSGAGDGNQSDPAKPAATVAGDPLAAHDPAPGVSANPGGEDRARPLMQVQVVLDRLGFTPGVVDGQEGLSTRNAIAGFQEARSLPVTGALDPATRDALKPWSNIAATRVVTIPADFAAGPFVAVPDKAADQAKLPRLGYASLEEKLAERFHTTPEVLAELNGAAPQADPTSAASPSAAAPARRFQAGQQIRVPNVGADVIDAASVRDSAWRDTLASLGVGTSQPRVVRIVVSKSKGTLKAYDKSDKLVGMYTATMGSRHDPLPLGQWKVVGVARNPDFAFNPELFWDVPDSAEKQRLPPGPNGPVGVAWIDLNKEHYGIHGTPEPQTIGRAQSHGCVRLTNWDVARLVQMLEPGAKVLFEA